MSSWHGHGQLYVRLCTSEDDRQQVHFALYKENMTLREFHVKIHKNSVGEISDSVYA
jgi:3-deoxy-D-manno-octulosonic-acid transferase